MTCTKLQSKRCYGSYLSFSGSLCPVNCHEKSLSQEIHFFFSTRKRNTTRKITKHRRDAPSLSVLWPRPLNSRRLSGVSRDLLSATRFPTSDLPTVSAAVDFLVSPCLTTHAICTENKCNSYAHITVWTVVFRDYLCYQMLSLKVFIRWITDNVAMWTRQQNVWFLSNMTSASLWWITGHYSSDVGLGLGLRPLNAGLGLKVCGLGLWGLGLEDSDMWLGLGV